MTLANEAVVDRPVCSNLGWTEERVRRLKALHEAGLTCSQIACELGGVSRNAVIGKIHRLGMVPSVVSGRMRTRAAIAARRPATPNSHAKLKLPRIERQKREEGAAARARRETQCAELRARFECVEIVDLPPDESAVAVPFLKLSATTCRWPLGDPRDLAAIRFCGAEPYQDYPYCSRHCVVAYRAPPRLPYIPGAKA